MLTVTGCSLPSDDEKPNEDYWMAGEDVALVLDGATIRTDTGCTHGLQWYVRTLGAGIFAAAQSPTTTLPDAIECGIQHVVTAHQHTCDLAHPGTPSAAVGLARDTGDQLEWAVLGDVTVLVDSLQAGAVVTSDDRVSRTALAERAECDRHDLGTDAKMTAIHAMKPRELAARNIEGGYWIASALPEAAGHAVTGSVLRRDARGFAVYSDGLARAHSFDLVGSGAELLDLLHAGGVAHAVETVRQAERDDPLGRLVPRNKTTDDATVLVGECRQ